jgi:hypothetical protein
MILVETILPAAEAAIEKFPSSQHQENPASQFTFTCLFSVHIQWSSVESRPTYPLSVFMN